eukprot:COSAG02_NODE_37322_length_443_cov_1.020349_1_plen_78_part_01
MAVNNDGRTDVRELITDQLSQRGCVDVGCAVRWQLNAQIVRHHIEHIGAGGAGHSDCQHANILQRYAQHGPAVLHRVP